ncbi:MAG TPA: sterol desaturase family protein [Mycobacteriales bacterium]|jgi:sterol desaturase/sphingolipid hydroxylase (fatty acid hydroxylase superfamily)|nr:sterol desaturase family protein [Mycobacteriales bacterium]
MAVPALPEIARGFARRPSARLLGVALAAALAWRLALGRWGVADAVTAGALLLAQPFVEWVVHVAVLHAKPFRVLGRTVDPGRTHRSHHADPRDPDHVVLDARGLAAGLLLAGGPLAAASVAAPACATFLVVAVAGLAAYEWVHYLIHTDHRPRTRLYRAAWRAHRLHHYRNERYWFGVTTPLPDLVLGTYRRRDDVPVS